MENNESKIKPQSTGGLKLMTVFIAVLALHVLVIGGFTVYHLMSGGTTDADLLTDKTHKDAKPTDGVVINDSSLPQAAPTDKSPATPPAPTDVASNPASSPTPPSDSTASTGTDTTAPTSATPATPANPTTPAPSAPALAITPVDIAPVPAPSAPVATGPVKMPVVQPQTATEPVTNSPYVVKSHDSLARIAHQNHTTVAKLKAANNLKGDVLQIGQKLVIPGGTQVATTSTPAATADASLNPTALSDPRRRPIMGASTTTAKAKTAAAVTPKATPTSIGAIDAQHHLYTVVKGDTLTRIAHKFKTTPTAIMTANNITDPAKLSIGKKLKIPSKEARSAKISEPAPAQPSPAKEAAPTAQLANFVPQG